MNDKLKEKKPKPKAIYEPGELDKVRQNLGEISPEEAMRVANVLGGEIGIEKTPQFDNFSKSRGIYVKVKQDKPLPARTQTAPTNYKPAEVVQKALTLPNIPPKDKAAIDKLMASSEYKIKRPQTFLNFLFSLGKLPDRVSGDFISITLLNYIGHIQKFTSCIKRLMAASSDLYKEKAKTTFNSRFKMLNFISKIDLDTTQELHKQLAREPNQITVTRLIPLVKSIYQPLLTVYFLGESRITSFIKTTYAEIVVDSKVPEETLLQYTKEACNEWIYINGQIIKGMYPLLLRMCGTEIVPYPKFFSAKISKILAFLNMTKFDLILPDDKPNATKDSSVVTNKKEEKTTENSGEKTETPKEEQKKEVIPDDIETLDSGETDLASIINQGLELLERIFPSAGWQNLGKEDLFPYFQPLYQFNDGFNLISPENPMQVTMILVRILEDFFQACRHINFTLDKDPEFDSYKDNLSDVFSDWSLYREVLFDKDYLSELKEYVNQIYSESNFKKLPYAKKKMSNMQWQIKNMFLPHLSFDLVFMERPNKDGSYIPLQLRVGYLKAIFSTLISRVEETPKDISGAPNILEKYHFDIPNVISKRVDVLLGGKKSKGATNLNLLKYTLSIICVLDWWVNDENSPAYSEDNLIPYRISSEDGTPVFSVPLRSDQNNLFIKSVKSRASAGK